MIAVNLLKLNFINKIVLQFAYFSIAKWNLGNCNKLQIEGKTSVLIMKIKNVWLLYLRNNANIIFSENIMNEFVMKQIFQSLKNGNTTLEDCPVPSIQSGNVLIESTFSLVSLGTEKMLVEFGSASLISKARQQPEKVKQVIDKIKSDGILPTLEVIFRKLDEDIPLGYSNIWKNY